MKLALILILSLVVYNSAEALGYKINGKPVTTASIVREIEAKFYQAINQHRLKIGLQPVQWHQSTSLITKQHVSDLSHYDLDAVVDNPDLRKELAHQNYQARNQRFSQILTKANCGGEITYLGLLLVFDQNGNLLIDASVNAVVKGFLNSPGHRNIIERRYVSGSFFGASTALVNDRFILVANFVGQVSYK